MQPISRRQLIQSSAALLVASSVPWTVPARAKAPAGVYVREQDLPVLEMDVAASIEKTTFITKSGRFDQMANGAIIMIPAGIDIPVSWWRPGHLERGRSQPTASPDVFGQQGGSDYPQSIRPSGVS